MKAQLFSYPVVIKEVYLDVYGHMNNTVYLTLYEEARWDLITTSGYGYNKIKDTGLGPIILEVKMRYLKELRLREEIVILSKIKSYEKKIGKLEQKMIRGEEICSTAEFTIALFDLKERKIVAPTAEWLKGIGVLGDVEHSIPTEESL